MSKEYGNIQSKLEKLKRMPNLDYSIIGYSVLGEPIYCFHTGKYGGKQALITGAMHAREWISFYLIEKQIINMLRKNHNGGVYYIPLVNPDGVKLALCGCKFLPQIYKNYVLELNNNNADFSLWKANINGVDLNVNFNALWGMGEKNVRMPASENYIGRYPHSEPETEALAKFAKTILPFISVAYHSLGNVVYYGFKTLNEHQQAKTTNIAKFFATLLNYTPIKTLNSCGGFSDYISHELHLPAVTIELGSEDLSHPITTNQLKDIWCNNKKIPACFFSRSFEKLT